ncbi:MAG: HesA/MoeB/ThiF family protein [Cyanobacteria bacterium J06649_11]
MQPVALTDKEKATYEWQMWVPDFGEKGQEKLKGSSVLISRAGGLGSVVAYELAAAGVGRIVLAHAGNVKFSDLNRQLLMTYDWLGKPRVESAAHRLKELNPHIEIVAVPENVSKSNAQSLIEQVDLVVDCAPLFEERFAMNSVAVRQGKPLVDCAMYELVAQITTIIPGKTPCLSCLYPEQPTAWKRQFPVFGAVSGTVGCLGAMEAIKVLSGVGEPLLGKMVTCDLRDMSFSKIKIQKRPNCQVCGGVSSNNGHNNYSGFLDNYFQDAG